MTRRPPVDRRELLLAVGVAVMLVLGRSIVPTLNEQLDFDSDQAIVGLMAKHLSEFRAFPLFFYGQHYMLGVQSWIAVPFFWVGGPTVAMLRLPLVLINAAVATIVIIAFARLGMRPLFAFVATLPLIVTTPVISSALVETLGASIEPFLYILLLWALRNRPAPFGAALCIAYLHREFTIFALPAAIIAQCRAHRDGRFLAFAKGAGAFAAVWILVDVLKQHASMLGPSGGSSEPGSLLREAETISRWLSFRGDEYVARLRSLCTHGLPDLFGAGTYRLLRYSVNSTLEAGSRFAGTALAVAAVLCLCRLLWHARDAARRNDFSRTSFALYLGLIAIQTIAAYGLNGGIDPAAPAVLRYVLFALLLPVSLFGAYFLVEATSTWRIAAAGLVGVWAVLTSS